MSNVLSEEKKQQILALGRLGWSLRRIERATGVRRETASAYLKEAGVAVSAPGRQGRRAAAKPAIEVTTDLDGAKPASVETTDPESAKPAIEVTTDPDGAKPGHGEATEGIHEASSKPEAETREGPDRSRIASACEIFREAIELWLAQGRNAVAIWQDLVSYHRFNGGYQSVKRFVRKLRGPQTQEACGIITTGPGEDYGEFSVMLRGGGDPRFLKTISAACCTGAAHNALKETQANR